MSWDLVGEEFIEAIEEFFTSRSLLKQTNHMVIVLVPKTNHSSSVGEYRHIACCNVFYKVITKILSSRLRPILGSIVDQAQAVFVEGRSMRVAPRCLLKIDLKKAYDSAYWNFLKNVLEGLQFPTTFIDWAMECITSPIYSIALNGSLHGFIKGRKGLRHGDPLSLFLFVLCLKYFSRMVKGAAENSEFIFHLKCAPLRITYLAFANDLMLFTIGDFMSIEI
ncbi:uncharacterized protein LOC111379310 [Olea europaea var. sylvestris]|uniref:uncharacterized protein LOC111379310 n=1 Tax=Olea europaea var. sylvestris TaxID=158386 RepID=UPI000C1CE4EB|nr:uncharacterized protein LOC111379310 [Olea europaea var. sylvestris]